MTIKTKLLALTTATAVAAGSLVPLATTAQAQGWGKGDRAEVVRVDRRYKKRGFRNNNRKFARKNFRKHNRNRHWNRGYAYKKKDRTGKYVAIGLGALMLGIIASSAARGHHTYDRYDY